jgi:hypothetical protein
MHYEAYRGPYLGTGQGYGSTAYEGLKISIPR